MAATAKIRTAQNTGLVIPLANEADGFSAFSAALLQAIKNKPVTVFLIVDNASKDKTLTLCEQLSARDARFRTIFDVKSKNVVDAYFRGFSEALNSGCDLVIEMDGGLSHDPAQIPMFIDAYENGYDCVFGSRVMEGSNTYDYNFKRRFLSRAGTVLANFFLGTRLKDMTSGFEAFDEKVLRALLKIRIRSKAHFIQTEIRYLCRQCKFIEIPISYHSPTPRVSSGAIGNAVSTLMYYFFRRLIFKPASL